MAGDIFATSASIVGVEREFSRARRQAEFNRTYQSDTFEAIMIAKGAIREENAQAIEDAFLDETIGDDLGLESANLREEVETRQRHVQEILEEGRGFISEGPDSEGSSDEDKDEDEDDDDDDDDDDDKDEDEDKDREPVIEISDDISDEEDSGNPTLSRNVVVPDSHPPPQQQKRVAFRNTRGRKRRRI